MAVTKSEWPLPVRMSKRGEKKEHTLNTPLARDAIAGTTFKSKYRGPSKDKSLILKYEIIKMLYIDRDGNRSMVEELAPVSGYPSTIYTIKKKSMGGDDYFEYTSIEPLGWEE